MSKNHYQMSAAASAQLEIDYLRDQLNQAKQQMKDVLFARELLNKRGYAVTNLWHVDDVTQNYKCTEEQAQEVLYKALTNDYTMSTIWEAIDVVAENLELTKIT